METVKREGIDIVLWMYPKVCLQKMLFRAAEKKVRIVSQIINQLGNDRIGIVAYAGSASGVAHHY
jgi:Ca-activated chloride channel family protein